VNRTAEWVSRIIAGKDHIMPGLAKPLEKFRLENVQYHDAIRKVIAAIKIKESEAREQGSKSDIADTLCRFCNTLSRYNAQEHQLGIKINEVVRLASVVYLIADII